MRHAAAVAAAVIVTGCGSATSTEPAPSSGAAEISPAGASLIHRLASAEGRVRALIDRSGCRADQIAVSTGEGGAGLGHVGLPLLFRNTRETACVLSGYPGATLVTARGHRVAARRTPAGYLGGLASPGATVPVVRVGAGATVSAYLEGLDADSVHGGSACPSYPWLLVTAPNERLTFRLASPISQVCGPEVHPIVPGPSGRAG